MRRFRLLPCSLATALLALPFASGGPVAAAQERHEGGGHAAGHEGHGVAEGARLTVEELPGEEALLVRLGPLALPAGAGHHEVSQPPARFLEVPGDGWLVSYRPRLVDAEGEPLPGRLLHHVAFHNTARSDLLCPSHKEHIFGAGGEMNEWIPLPGVGYRVREGDRIRVGTMFHNPTPEERPEVYLEVRVGYRAEAASEESLRNIYPVWFDVQECSTSDYDLVPGTNVTEGTLEVPVDGRLLGVGGHLHRYGKELVLARAGEEVVAASGPEEGEAGAAAGREVARLAPRTDEEGRILSMPVVPFLMTGGLPLRSGDRLRVTARYENPTGRTLVEGAMGIVVGYFLPDDDAEMSRFRRAAP